MVQENVSFMKDFKPLDAKEMKTIQKITEIFHSMNLIPCTACKYCMEQCPKHIAIPDFFACLNAKKHFNDWNADYYYHNIQASSGRKASDCIRCGRCEKICPQHLPIRDLLVEVQKEFE